MQNKKLEKYFELLKKCRTLASASQVLIAVLLDESLENKQKDIFSDVYVEYTQNFNF
jgi:hypothetical protein